jgi:hypothetical protein
MGPVQFEEACGVPAIPLDIRVFYPPGFALMKHIGSFAGGGMLPISRVEQEAWLPVETAR